MNTKEIIEVLTENISKVIKGKNEKIKIFVSVFLSGGHILLDDIPGVGKTTMVKALAKLLKKAEQENADFKRLQCTPDLLPYDITGVDIFNTKTQEFEFLPGPIFCDIFLADELNRTPPKVQSALLEVMEEKQVTVAGKTNKLSEFFFTAATQNPLEFLGTYPLPAAQLDRFMASISLGYPDDNAALEILNGNLASGEINTLEPLVSFADIEASRKEQGGVFCHQALKQAIIDICNKLRNHNAVELGPSPRASLHLLALAKTIALSSGRNWVEDKDLKNIIGFVFAHRCILKNEKMNSTEIINEITETVLATMDKNTDWTKA